MNKKPSSKTYSKLARETPKVDNVSATRGLYHDVSFLYDNFTSLLESYSKLQSSFIDLQNAVSTVLMAQVKITKKLDDLEHRVRKLEGENKPRARRTKGARDETRNMDKK